MSNTYLRAHDLRGLRAVASIAVGSSSPRSGAGRGGAPGDRDGGNRPLILARRHCQIASRSSRVPMVIL
jgi:hypothetical protein